MLIIKVKKYIYTTRSGCWEGQLEESEFLALYRLPLCVEVLNNFPSGDISFHDIQLYFMNLYSSRHSSPSIFFIFIHASRERVGQGVKFPPRIAFSAVQTTSSAAQWLLAT